MNLRSYQKQDAAAILDALSTSGRALLVRPTGTGKTRTAVAALEHRRMPPMQVLMLTHRAELWQRWRQELADSKHPISFLRKGQAARRALPHFDLVVVDEAHNALAPEFRSVIDRLGGTPRLGLTATPYRMDDPDCSRLFDLFGEPVGAKRETQWFIDEGFLVDVCGDRNRHAYIDCYLENLDLRGVSFGSGEYPETETALRLRRANAPEQCARAWAKQAKNRKGLLFTLGVENAEKTVRELTRRGIPARLFAGPALADESKRKAALAWFKAQRRGVLVNTTVLAEGFDDPAVDCIAFARPCLSLALAVQILGRGLRPSAGKRACLVLDFCGVLWRHKNILEPMSEKPQRPLQRERGGRLIEPSELPTYDPGFDRAAKVAMKERRLRELAEAKAKRDAKILRLAAPKNGVATNPSRAISDAAGCSRDVVRATLLSGGIRPMNAFEVRGGGALRNAKILALAAPKNGVATRSSTSIARKIGGIGYMSVQRTLRRNGIRPLNVFEASGGNTHRDSKILALAAPKNGVATKSCPQIAQKAGCSDAGVRVVLLRNGIRPMNRSEARRAGHR